MPSLTISAAFGSLTAAVFEQPIAPAAACGYYGPYHSQKIMYTKTETYIINTKTH